MSFIISTEERLTRPPKPTGLITVLGNILSEAPPGRQLSLVAGTILLVGVRKPFCPSID
jgi:hypothetical protein